MYIALYFKKKNLEKYINHPKNLKNVLLLQIFNENNFVTIDHLYQINCKTSVLMVKETSFGNNFQINLIT